MPAPPGDPPRVPSPPRAASLLTQAADAARERRRTQRQLTATSTGHLTAEGAVADSTPLELLPDTDGEILWTPAGAGVYSGIARCEFSPLPEGAKVWAELVDVSGTTKGSESSERHPFYLSASVSATARVFAGKTTKVVVFWTAPDVDPETTCTVNVQFTGTRL